MRTSERETEKQKHNSVAHKRKCREKKIKQQKIGVFTRNKQVICPKRKNSHSNTISSLLFSVLPLHKYLWNRLMECTHQNQFQMSWRDSFVPF